MKIAAASLHPYALPLRAPLPGVPGADGVRRGWLLRLVAAGGQVEYGEVAPLPGFSQETPAQAEIQARALLPRLAGDWPEAPPAALESVSARLGDGLAASVRCGVEVALLNLLAVVRGRAWHAELGSTGMDSVPVSALVAEPPAAWVSAAHAAMAAGYTTLKLKARGVPPLAVAAALRDLRRVAPPPALAVRVDANRAWTPAEARTFCGQARDCAVEYVEEPLADPRALPDLAAAGGVPVAIDETLRQELAAGRPPPPATVWIVKPMLWGGVSGALALAGAARGAGRPLVISSSFESGVGLRALFMLAALLQPPGVAAGLGTAAWFAEDVLHAPPAIRGGAVALRELGVATPLRAEVL